MSHGGPEGAETGTAARGSHFSTAGNADPVHYEPTSAASPSTSLDAHIIEADSFPTSGDEDDGGGSDGNSTQSLTNSVWTYYRENGRTYHGYRSGMYPFPNDATETERLDFQYDVITHVMEGHLHLAPITNPGNVLDIGTGTGTWAIEMGDMYPGATIEATDLSPIQPTAVPDNVQFIIDDAEQDDWAVPLNHYDFIHTRMMLGCFRDFRAIAAHAFTHVRPGGYMESQEIMSSPQCDDGTMPADWPFKEWTHHLDDAAMSVDRPLRIANKMKRWFTEVGFVDVQEKIIKIPVNTWPKDPALKPLGKWWQQNLLLGLQGFSLAHFSRALGWSKDEIEVYLVNVRKSLENRHVHAYHKLYVVWGRKPGPADDVHATPTHVDGPAGGNPPSVDVDMTHA